MSQCDISCTNGFIWQTNHLGKDALEQNRQLMKAILMCIGAILDFLTNENIFAHRHHFLPISQKVAQL